MRLMLSGKGKHLSTLTWRRSWAQGGGNRALWLLAGALSLGEEFHHSRGPRGKEGEGYGVYPRAPIF